VADPSRDGGHCPYQALPLLPGIWVARLLGLRPTAISLVWRAWGGFWAGLAWYVLSRCHLSRRWAAAALAVLMLTDIGMLEFRPLLRLWFVAWQVWNGQAGGLFASKPLVFSQWRVATPCLTMPFLLLFLALHARARMSAGRGWRVAAGVGFGLLFYVYFYYWTAAALALILATALDRGHRRDSVDAAWIGGLIGMPHVVFSYLMKRATSDDWLLRSDKFLRIDRFSELLIPKPAVVLLLVSLFVVWRHRRDLILLWSLAASGLALMNHQLITGLQVENFHWGYVCGPCLSLLVGLLLVNWLSGRLGMAFLILLSSLSVGVALWLRSVEAVRTREPVQILATYQAYRDHRLRGSATPRLAPHAVIAADELTADWAGILEHVHPLSNYWVVLSPSVDNAELDFRVAFNAYVLGRDRPTFLASQTATPLGPAFRGAWGRDPAQQQRRLASRLAWFDAVSAEPERYLRRTELRYLLLPRDQSPPSGASWTEIQDGPHWSIWEPRVRETHHLRL
jgi:hypothetical protein